MAVARLYLPSFVKVMHVKPLPYLRRLDLVAWKPRRKHADKRRPTRYVLGVTNKNRMADEWWVITEVDRHDVDYLNAPYPLAMVIATRKGYHFYWAASFTDPQLALGMAQKLLKLGYEDRGHYKLARSRNPPLLILRISPKYREPDLVPIYVNPAAMSWWHIEVLQMIAFCCSNPEVCEQTAREVVKRWV